MAPRTAPRPRDGGKRKDPAERGYSVPERVRWNSSPNIHLTPEDWRLALVDTAHVHAPRCTRNCPSSYTASHGGLAVLLPASGGGSRAAGVAFGSL